jgi:hypothetical protein
MTELHRAKLGFVVLASATLATLTGCANFDLRKNIPWGEGTDGKFEKPMQVAAFWTPTVQNRHDDAGLRGFGARLYFYGKNPNKPTKVTGSLVVYAFDEKGRDANNVVPDKKYVFTADQFKTKYSKSELGHSYSVWLPWDEVNGEQKDVTLIARFTSDTGEMVSSDPTLSRLPGLPPAGTPGAAAKPSSLSEQFAAQQAAAKVIPPQVNPQTGEVIQAGGIVTQSVMSTTTKPTITTVSGEAPIGSDPEKRTMKTTTIPLSNSIQTRGGRGGNQGLPVISSADNGWQPMTRSATAPAQLQQPAALPALAEAPIVPGARSGFARRLAPGGLISRLASDRAQLQQSLEESQSAHSSQQ